jgi:purine-binding chemotaxis protein CheW
MSEQQVLEFRLNDEQYCTGIEHISEIVRRSSDDIRSIPDAPPHVEGITNLRGEMTKIVDPQKKLSLEGSANLDSDTILVFSDVDAESERFGWMVADVTRVSTIDTDDVEPLRDSETNSVEDNELVNGVVSRDGEFTIWVAPKRAHEQVSTTPG